MAKKQLISFRIDSNMVDALDALAEALDRDRTYLLNEAVAAYLNLQQWQLEHIKAINSYVLLLGQDLFLLGLV